MTFRLWRCWSIKIPGELWAEHLIFKTPYCFNNHFNFPFFILILYLLKPQFYLSIKKVAIGRSTIKCREWIHDLSRQNMEITRTKTKNVIKMNKCNQCNYASSHKGHLKVHMKIHSGEKTNKCNECDYSCSLASELKNHFTNLTNATDMTMHFPGQAIWGVVWKHHGGEKSNKCNQCGYASSHVSNLKTNVKMYSGEKSNNCNQCDF